MLSICGTMSMYNLQYNVVVCVKMQERNKEFNSDLIIGRNPVNEAIMSSRPIESVLVARGSKTGSNVAIIAKAKDRGITVKEVDVKKLNYMTNNANHQGIAAIAAVKEYSSLEDILENAQSKNEQPFIVVLDGIEDPHNLGAIIRTAECCGVHGIIIKKRNSAGLTFTVDKTSAGALEYMPVCRVTNISDTLEQLKKEGFWIYGADMNGEDYTKADFSGKTVLVIGNEGKGISRLVREKCDVIVSLPMKGHISSLNASVAAGVLMYKIIEKR